ncbi:hypothetical protein ACNULB_06190 [Clostridium perfringens]
MATLTRALAFSTVTGAVPSVVSKLSTFTSISSAHTLNLYR